MGQVDGSQSLLDLLAGRPSSIELDRVALEIAGIEYPNLNPEPYIAQLDEFAFAIANRAHELSDAEEFIEAANTYLFGEAGFQGNDADYYNPDNSCLNRVIESRMGIPITLSVIYIEVARRLAKPVSGVGLPGHFLVQYDDGRFRVLIDPFHGGAIVNEERCCELAQMQALDPEMLAPVGKRYIAMRMINNLRRIYFARRDAEKVVRVLDLLIAANPGSAEEYRQRAVARLQQQKMAEAMGDFRKYLELWPEAPDRGRIEEQMRKLAVWIAARN